MTSANTRFERTVQIIYRAFPRAGSPVATEQVTVNIPGDDLAICEQVFANTNLYDGEIWDALQPLPDERTHTSLSVGDVVIVDGRAYECASLGFERIVAFDSDAPSAPAALEPEHER